MPNAPISLRSGQRDPQSRRDTSFLQASNDPGRTETEEEREDRNLIELLQELRVASIGVQVLFGFLLSLPFSTRFGRLDLSQRHLYVVIVLLTAASIAQLSAPVAYHRIVFRRHRKAALLRTANCLALTGLATVGLSVCGAVLLILGTVLSGFTVPLLALLTVGVFVCLWLVLPVASLRGGPSR
jgi:hypothetical protein